MKKLAIQGVSYRAGVWLQSRHKRWVDLNNATEATTTTGLPPGAALPQPTSETAPPRY